MSSDQADIFAEHAEAASGRKGLFEPSRDELDVLTEHEPGITFRTATDAVITGGISAGRQSRVSVLEYELENTTYRVVWKRMGAGKNLNHDEARQLWERLTPYRSSLEEAGGWHVPKLLYAKVEKLGAESQIFSYEEYIPGGDAEHMIADPRVPNFRKWYVVEKVLRALYAYPEMDLMQRALVDKSVHLLPHGLDLKLANLVLHSETSQLYFVDLFGPKELTPVSREWVTCSSKLDSLPPDHLRVVTASREGLILRFWRLARRTWEPDKARRRLLQDDFLERLKALDPPESEFRLVRDEVENDFPWLDKIYLEHRV